MAASIKNLFDRIRQTLYFSLFYNRSVQVCISRLKSGWIKLQTVTFFP